MISLIRYSLRAMGPCFGNIDLVCQRAYNHTNPGGYIEFQNVLQRLKCIDNTAQRTALERWFAMINEGAAIAGRDLSKAETLQYSLKTAGFVDVKEDVYEVAGGTWPKDRKMKVLGMYNRNAALLTIDGTFFWQSLFHFWRIASKKFSPSEIVL